MLSTTLPNHMQNCLELKENWILRNSIANSTRIIEDFSVKKQRLVSTYKYILSIAMKLDLSHLTFVFRM